jgi:hypothetical protein
MPPLFLLLPLLVLLSSRLPSRLLLMPIVVAHLL